MPEITSYTAAHMAVQIIAKQLATESSHKKLIEQIKEAVEDSEDQSSLELNLKFKNDFAGWAAQVSRFDANEQLAVDVGFPIFGGVTYKQLNSAYGWMMQQEEDGLLAKLSSGNLYNGFRSQTDRELPNLQNPGGWGSEQPSVSTVLLYSAAHSLGLDILPDQLPGAAKFYPFINQNYEVKSRKIFSNSKIETENNPFISEGGMVLFGDYQHLGHSCFSSFYPEVASEADKISGWRMRTFEKPGQFLFSPEDDYSSIAKATGLEERLYIKLKWSGVLREAYVNPGNEFGLRAVTSSVNARLNFEEIESGDIVLMGVHPAIVASKDHRGFVETFEFNRIWGDESKILGGGVNYHHLQGAVDGEQSVHVLRGSKEPLGESISLEGFIEQIDTKYAQDYAEARTDVAGDCSVFFEL